MSELRVRVRTKRLGIAVSGEAGRVLSAGLLLLLTACATSPRPESSVWPWPDPPRSDQQPPSTQSSRPAPMGDPAVAATPERPTVLLAQTAAGRALVEDARTARAAGDGAGAARSLERAIAISPRDPVLWYELGLTRQQQGRLDEAEDLALRAVDYADPGTDIHAACWTLVGDLRSARGDRSGARDAYAQARVRS